MEVACLGRGFDPEVWVEQDVVKQTSQQCSGARRVNQVSNTEGRKHMRPEDYDNKNNSSKDNISNNNGI